MRRHSFFKEKVAWPTCSSHCCWNLCQYWAGGSIEAISLAGICTCCTGGWGRLGIFSNAGQALCRAGPLHSRWNLLTKAWNEQVTPFGKDLRWWNLFTKVWSLCTAGNLRWNLFTKVWSLCTAGNLKWNLFTKVCPLCTAGNLKWNLFTKVCPLCTAGNLRWNLFTKVCPLFTKVWEGCLSSKANPIYGSPTIESLASVMFVGVLVTVFVGLSNWRNI